MLPWWRHPTDILCAAALGWLRGSDRSCTGCVFSVSMENAVPGTQSDCDAADVWKRAHQTVRLSISVPASRLLQRADHGV